MNTFKEYEEASVRTMHTDFNITLEYLTLGLTEESGEVAGQVKRVFRDDAGVVTPHRKTLLLKELGDTLWYLTQVANKLGSSLEEVAKLNISKLESRRKKNTLRGSGNER